MVSIVKREAQNISRKHTGGLFDVATVTVVLLVAGLWVCWPRLSAPARVRINAHEFISYANVPSATLKMIREPLLFLRYEPHAMPALDDDVANIYARFSATGRKSLVALPAAQGPSSIFDLNSILRPAENSSVRMYQAPPPATAVFDVHVDTTRAIDVVLSPSLEAIGLKTNLTKADFKGFNESGWLATLELSGEKGNRPEDVFVVESSGNTELDLRLVRVLSASEMGAQMTPWRGRVVVSYRVE